MSGAPASNSARSSRSMRMTRESGSAERLTGTHARSFPLTLSAGSPYAVPSFTPVNLRPMFRTTSKSTLAGLYFLLMGSVLDLHLSRPSLGGEAFDDEHAAL